LKRFLEFWNFVFELGHFGRTPLLFTWTVEDGTEEDEVEEEEEEGRGADLRWLRGCAAGSCWPENGLDSSRPFFFFSAFFLLLCSSLFLFSSSVSHGAVVDGEDSGSWRWWWCGCGTWCWLASGSSFFLCVSLLLFCFSSALLFLLFPVLFFLSLSGPLKCSLFYSFFPSATVFIPALFFFFVSGFLKWRRRWQRWFWSQQFPLLTFFPSARFCLPLVLLPHFLSCRARSPLFFSFFLFSLPVFPFSLLFSSVLFFSLSLFPPPLFCSPLVFPLSLCFFSFLCLVVFSSLGFFYSSCSPPSSSFIFLFLPPSSLCFPFISLLPPVSLVPPC